MTNAWWGPTLAVTRLAMRRTLLARRNLWVYLLALAPVVLFAAHAAYAPHEQDRLARLAASHPASGVKLRSVHVGQSAEDVLAQVGDPYTRRTWRQRAEGGRIVEREFRRYTDGKSDFAFRISDGSVTRVNRTDPESLSQASAIFATVFQVFFLRLAIFFGCVGVFTNLFRGEMLDKSLHFYLLTPIRREVLVIGKYLAGLIATVGIFVISAALQFPAMLFQFDAGAIGAYMSGGGWGYFAAYLGIAALACAAYGSVFLAAGLVFRNPIIPVAIVLMWESATLFVPVSLKKLSLIYYLQSLCPIPAGRDLDLPPAIALLISDAEPASTRTALVVISVIILTVLTLASLRARKLEINYGTD